jgi:hypothetical protein
LVPVKGCIRDHFWLPSPQSFVRICSINLEEAESVRAVLLIIALSLASQADASMITSDFATEDLYAGWEKVLAIAGPVPTMQSSDRSDEQDEGVEEEPPVPVAHPAPSSMSGGSRSTGEPVSYDLSAAVESTDSAEAELLAWFIRESKVLQPVPFLDGIFRPPRC